MLGNQPQGLLHARQVLYHWATFLAQAEAVHTCQWTMHEGPASGMGIRERLAVQYLNLHCVCYQLGGRWNEALPKFQTLEHLWRKWSWISGLALAIKTIRQKTWFTWVQRYLLACWVPAAPDHSHCANQSSCSVPAIDMNMFTKLSFVFI